MTPTYESTLRDLAVADDRIMVLTAENRAAIRGLPPSLGPRFLDTGITEQTMVGMAAGLALRGRIPVAHALAAFLTMRPFEFIRTDVGIPGLPVKLVGGVPGVLSEANGPTHQALEDVSLMRTVPNLRVFCPADTADLLAGLGPILADPHPWYIRYIDRPAVIRHEPFEIGKAEVVTEGRDIVILSYGALFREAHDAAGRLIVAGHSVRLLNIRTLDPIDEAAILAAADAPLVVVVEDHFRTGGLYSIVAETLLAAGRSARVLPISFPDRWFTPTLLADVLRVEELTADHLVRRILAALPPRAQDSTHA